MTGDGEQVGPGTAGEHDADGPAGPARLGPGWLATVVVASTRAASGVYEDRAGPILVDGLRAMGFTVEDPVVVPDGEEVGAALRGALDRGVDVVLTSGGTGLNPTDTTPEQTLPLLERGVPGLAEALRRAGAQAGVATAALSRGVAGVAGSTLVVNVAGSPGACRDAVAVLGPVLGHAVSQLRGGDHPSGPPARG